jgi:hypothetical protein
MPEAFTRCQKCHNLVFRVFQDHLWTDFHLGTDPSVTRHHYIKTISSSLISIESILYYPLFISEAPYALFSGLFRVAAIQITKPLRSPVAGVLLWPTLLTLVFYSLWDPLPTSSSPNILTFAVF